MPKLISFLGFFVVAFAAALTYEVAPEYELDFEPEKALDTANDPWTDSWIDEAKQSKQDQERAETSGSNHHLEAEMTNERAMTAPFGAVPRIIGGELADIKNFPYMVSVLEGKGVVKYHICGGSIISSQWVLTAAHCFYPNNSISEYTVRVGATNIRVSSSKGIDFSVSKIIPHYFYKKYDHVPDFDIAVVRINGEFNFTDYVQPIRLADCLPPHGNLATVTGWGFTTETGRPSDTLRSLAVPILCQKTCKKLYRRYPITPRMFCAGYIAGGKDACTFDSGGPLVFQGEQVGVMSWGVGCAKRLFPGVYTNVVYLRSWISDVSGI